jgi:NACHT domain/TIR domain
MEQLQPASNPMSVFYSYAHGDEALRNELEKHLSALQRQGFITGWHDRKIVPGTDWAQAIDFHLNEVSIILLLISPDFLASDYCYGIEMKHALERHAAQKARVIPILLRPVDWKGAPFAHLQVLPTNTKAITTWRNRDSAFTNVVEGIRRAIEEVVRLSTNSSHSVQEKQRQEDKAFAEEYCAALCSDPLLTKIQVLDMDHSLALEDIHVHVRIRHESRFLYLAESTEQSVQDPLSIFNLQQKYLEERERGGMEPAMAVRKHPHCVVVGDPGVGKTTLLKYLALQCACGKLGQLAYCALFVSLHDFARKSRGDHNLVEYVLAEWERVYHLPRERAHGFLERQMSSGRVLVLLDALDETMIGEESTQAEQTYQAIHEAVSDLHRSYPHTPMVVTARKAAYHQHSHLVGFDLLEVVDFLPEQIEIFVKNWFRHDPNEERRGMGEGLLTRLQNNPRISALVANPLLLGLIAYTYEENNERLPANRADLYKLCIETLLRKWDDKRKIRRAHPAIDTYEQERLLPRLAWHFHAQGLRYFTQRELLACIREFVEALGRSTREEHLQDILNEITSDNGLLREQAPGYYGFLHLTLQEYFTARHLTNILGLELLLEHLSHPWWEEVVLLYAGQADDTSDLLERLLSPGAPGEAPEDIFCSKLLLAGHCLAAQVQIIRNKQLRIEIPNLLLEKLHSPFTLLQQQAAEVLAEIGRAYPEHEVNERLFAIVEDKEEDEKLRTIVLDGIGIAGGQRLQQRLLPLVWQSDRNLQHLNHDWSFRNKIIDILGQFTDKTLQQEAKTKLFHKDLPLEVLECIVILLCQCADTATLEWLFEWLEKEQNAILSARAFSTLNSHKSKREDLSIAIPYVSSFFKKRLSNLKSGYGYGVQLLGHFPSSENIMLLEIIVFDKTLNKDERKYALEALTRLNYQASEKMLYQILVDPTEEETLREATVQWLPKYNQPDQKEKLLLLLQSEEMPLTIRLTIAARLANWHAQEVIPVLWEFFQRQKTEPITRENLYFCIQPLILLLEQNEKKAIQEIIEILENVESDIWSIFPGGDGKSVICLPVPDGTYYTTFSKRIAEKFVDRADPLTLNAFCFNRQIQFLIRRDLIRQIAQIGKQANAYIPAFLAELEDRTVIEDVRVALTEALGELATDEKAVAALMNLYQEELFPRVKDALHTALYKIARRANVTIVPDGPEGSVPRLVRR